MLEIYTADTDGHSVWEEWQPMRGATLTGRKQVASNGDTRLEVKQRTVETVGFLWWRKRRFRTYTYWFDESLLREWREK